MRSTIHTRAQVTKQWTAEDVLRQSRQWVSPWYPPTARHVVVDDYEFYVQDAKATLMTHCAVRPDRSSIAGAMCAASQSGADTLTVTFGAQPAGDELSLADLAEFGDSEHVGTTDVLALNLDGFDPADVPVPAGISVDTVGTLKQFAEYERTSACAWGYPEPTDADIRAGFEKLTPGWFVAYHAGTPIGTGGYSLVGVVARFWGAAVVPDARGQGAYRGLVAARLKDAANRGATLALTHAEPTSSPILRRLGFHKYGEQRTFRFEINPPVPPRQPSLVFEPLRPPDSTTDMPAKAESHRSIGPEDKLIGDQGGYVTTNDGEWPSALAATTYGDLVSEDRDHALSLIISHRNRGNDVGITRRSWA